MSLPHIIDELNPGIRRVVALLQANGFRTVDSGDGETHLHACDREVGYVAIRCPARSALVVEAERLAALLRAYGITVVPIGQDGGSCIQATYDPADGTAILDVTPIHDRMLKAGG